MAPPRNNGLLPNRSEKGPATSCPKAIEINKTDSTSCAMFESAFRSIAIAGMAGATKVTANGASPRRATAPRLG